MCRFIESIRVENGRIPLLEEHQARINTTLAQFEADITLSLRSAIDVPASAQEGIYKCRIVYNADGISEITYDRYEIKAISTFSTVEIGGHSYRYKYENRDWINDLVNKSGSGDIIMCKNDRITDSSYANLAFYDGSSWFTPKYPLLKGTRRSLLLKEKMLSEKDIFLKDVSKFSHFKYINAMMLWNEAPVFETLSIQGLP
jgi:4-amino-4-deoxychorismate lyase